jgi:hypothetical protein
MLSFIRFTFLLYTSIKLTYSSACDRHSHEHADLVEHYGSENADALFFNRNLGVQPDIESCGFEEPSEEQVAIDKVLMRKWSRERVGADSSVDYTIPTYFHFLQYNSSDLFLSDSNVNTYMNYLNTAFNKSNAPFLFSLMGITRTINATWSNNCRDYQLTYKSLLRRGGKETLNIYICNTIPAGPNGGYITGFSNMPSANFIVTDGVTIVRSTPTDLQRQNTLVHEVVSVLDSQ